MSRKDSASAPKSQPKTHLANDPERIERQRAAVAELVHGCERAVRDHFFKETYPAEVRERTLRIKRLAEWLDEQAARARTPTELDMVACLYLPAFEKAAEEHAELRRLMRDAGWLRDREGGRA